MSPLWGLANAKREISQMGWLQDQARVGRQRKMIVNRCILSSGVWAWRPNGLIQEIRSAFIGSIELEGRCHCFRLHAAGGVHDALAQGYESRLRLYLGWLGGHAASAQMSYIILSPHPVSTA